jgi:hypothetical protein
LEIAEPKGFALSPIQSFRWNFRFRDKPQGTQRPQNRRGETQRFSALFEFPAVWGRRRLCGFLPKQETQEREKREMRGLMRAKQGAGAAVVGKPRC